MKMYDLDQAKSQFKKYADSPFRKFQSEAIRYALESDKKIIVLEASTGSGKSLIGMTAGAAMSGCVYLVHTKILQNQITADFPEAQSLFGRSNYQCLNNPSLNCDECSWTQKSLTDPSSCLHKKTDCNYESRKRAVLKARYKILNYDYFLSEANYVGKFSDQPFIVIDEADSLENTLINFVTLQFSTYTLRRLGMLEWAAKLKMSSKDKSGLLESWKEFGEQASQRVGNIIKKLSNEIDSWGNNPNPQQADVIKERIRVIRLKEKIDLFLTNVDNDWTLDNKSEDYKDQGHNLRGALIFRPLWMTESLANEYLWRHGHKFLLMSASFYPKPILAKILGLDTDDMDYHEVPSQFPTSNRPVYIHPAANMTARTTDTELPKLIKAIKQIVDDYTDVKGIIHAVSYKLANSIMEGVASPRLITHNSSDRQEVIDRFMSSSDPLILVSPSLERGISLEDELCRVIIICKAPYLYLGDKIVSARLYSGKIGQSWYTATMLLTILQMAGRGVRSKDDFADTYILDQKAKEAITSNPGFLPTWWLDALEFELPTRLKNGFTAIDAFDPRSLDLDDVPF
jgi:Rad3-related DNA helicase